MIKTKRRYIIIQAEWEAYELLTDEQVMSLVYDLLDDTSLENVKVVVKPDPQGVAYGNL